MSVIERLNAIEILDSRGRPTVLATVELKGVGAFSASVPSGASTGTAEALELRDGDPARYGGLGCLHAVANIRGPIASAIRGKRFEHQSELDQLLRQLDGSSNFSHLGANAVLAVSLAFARAQAAEQRLPLFKHFANMVGARVRTLPRLTINLFSGGKHAGCQAPIQDVLLVPSRAKTISEGLANVYSVYQTAALLIRKKYDMRALKADEGGLAPPFETAESMLSDATEAIRDAGLEPGRDMALAIDVASTHFFDEAKGCYALDNQALCSAEMIERIVDWSRKYPIVSVEDALSENDWTNWPKLCARLGHQVLVLGDDFLCTNPDRIRRAVQAKAASALLLKVNQIGTLSLAAEALKLARKAEWKVTISARSGETEDSWLADLAVGWQADQIKVGSICQSDRLSKYNRLLCIEHEAGLALTNWPLSRLQDQGT